MMRLAPFFIALLLGAFWGHSAAAQPAPDAQTTRAALKGGWDVAYRDDRLGLVTGRAYFDPDSEYGEVTYKVPGTGSVKLTAQSITIKGALVRVLWAKVPSDTPSTFDPIGQKISPPSPRLQLGLGQTKRTVVLGTPPPLDGTLTSELTYYPKSKSFSGHWGQRVDAVTGRSGGAARTGVFNHGPSTQGGGIMTGEEMWVPPQPIIKDTFSIRNQFAIGPSGPAYPHPYGLGKTPSDYLNKRYVFIYGRNLPHRRSEGITVESLDEDVRYYVYALKTIYDETNAFNDPELRDKGLERVELEANAEKPRYTRQAGDDFLILEATLKPGVGPGYKGLKINGVETAWLLRFGDHVAQLGFARDLTLGFEEDVRAGLPPETEFADLLYTPEQIIVELRTEIEVHKDEFHALVAKNGKQLKFAGKRGVTLYKQKQDGSTRVYRSKPIYLVRPGEQSVYPPGAFLVPAKPGDTLQATLTGPPVLRVDKPLVNAKVIATPQNLLKAIQGDDAPKALMWREAVVKAAQCVGVDNLESQSTAQLSRLEASSFRDVVISTLWRDVETVLKTRINIGEYAGTIMMRPVFQSMLEVAAESYAAPMKDGAIIGLRRTLEYAITKGNHPLGAVMVDAPSGPQIPLSLTFYDAYLDDTYKLSAKAKRAYKIKTMRGARTQFAPIVRESAKKAKETDDCDIKEMLYLTGLGTQMVQQRTYSALMSLKTITQTFNDANGTPVSKTRTQWVANPKARARIANVPLYARTLKEQEKLSDDAWDKYFLTVSLLSLPIGLGAEVLAIESVVFATALLDAGDLLMNLVQESSKQYAESVELDFARGASVVLGTSRLRQAELDDTSGLAAYFKTLASVAQAANAAASLSSAARLHRSVKRANRAIKSIDASGKPPLEAYQALKPALKTDIYQTFIEAMRKELALGRELLNPSELRALKFEEALFPNGIGVRASDLSVRPQWAAALDEQAFLRLDDMVSQPHVQKLVRANAPEMNRLLMDDDALALLRLPQNDVTSFQRAVARLKNRAPPRGPDFVNQAAPSNGNPEGLYYKTKVSEVDGYRRSTVQVYAGQNAAGTIYGEFIRGRMPDTVFGSGKDVLVFELAMANRMELPDTLLASPGRFIPGSPTLDMSVLRSQGQWVRRAGPRWVYDVQVPLRDGDPGVPFVMFNNLRSAKNLGFAYADPQLGGIMLKNVASANTTGQLQWLRYQYPGRSVDELFRYTHSFRYAENTAQQLGFRITDVKVVGAVPGEPGYVGAYKTLDNMVKDGRWFDPAGAKTAQEATAAQRAFIEQYTVPGNPHIVQSYNVYLKFEPL
jgi:hypothetical protein